MKNKKNIGSNFESFLEEEGIVEEVNAAAIKAVIAQKRMKEENVAQTNIAEQ